MRKFVSEPEIDAGLVGGTMYNGPWIEAQLKIASTTQSVGSTVREVVLEEPDPLDAPEHMADCVSLDEAIAWYQNQ